MSNNVLCLSGWAQKHNSLETLFPDSGCNTNILNFDYSLSGNYQNFLDRIKKLKFNPKIAIGWSLGGQLICRLIDQKIITPQYLILISTPFQFVKSAKIAAAMPQKSFDDFFNNFSQNPDRLMKKFSLLMNIKDKNAKELSQNLDINQENHKKLEFWLQELQKFSCHDLKFQNFLQKTIIFHGTEDMVVHHSQSNLFFNKIPNAKLHNINKCGHTPHISHNRILTEKITSFLQFDNR